VESGTTTGLPSRDALSHHCTAREKVRVARSLNKLPEINNAFATGELSYSKVRAMTRVATDDNEQQLLEVSKLHTASFMEKYVKRFRRVDENQQPLMEVDELAERLMDYYQDSDGRTGSRSEGPQLFVSVMWSPWIGRQEPAAGMLSSAKLCL